MINLVITCILNGSCILFGIYSISYSYQSKVRLVRLLCVLIALYVILQIPLIVLSICDYIYDSPSKYSFLILSISRSIKMLYHYISDMTEIQVLSIYTVMEPIGFSQNVLCVYRIVLSLLTLPVITVYLYRAWADKVDTEILWAVSFCFAIAWLILTIQRLYLIHILKTSRLLSPFKGKVEKIITATMMMAFAETLFVASRFLYLQLPKEYEVSILAIGIATSGFHMIGVKYVYYELKAMVLDRKLRSSATIEEAPLNTGGKFQGVLLSVE